jgi:hypothetical protein
MIITRGAGVAAAGAAVLVEALGTTAAVVPVCCMVAE